MSEKPKKLNLLTSSLWWWLGKSKPFFINDEYKIELLFIDTENYSAKIRITNIKNSEFKDTELAGGWNDEQ